MALHAMLVYSFTITFVHCIQNGPYEWQTVFQSTMQIMQATVCSENTKGKQFLWESPETLLNCKHLFGA